MTTMQPDVETVPDIIEFTEEYESTDDPNVRTHIVRPRENGHIYRKGMTAQDIVNSARRFGVDVIALCGYQWTPKHNPDKFDACEPCIKIAGDIMRAGGE